ncbi:hypothetical protein I204_05084 [Kwoniella mangroviensis CBS 8886]|nr:hypothetical protein I204_05084 [Kwoniella mangroviensis CBS 8886]
MPNQGVHKQQTALRRAGAAASEAAPEAGPSSVNLSGVELIKQIQEGFDRLAELSGNAELAGYRPKKAKKAAKADNGKPAEPKSKMTRSITSVNKQISAILRDEQRSISAGQNPAFRKVLAQLRGKYIVKAREMSNQEKRLMELREEADHVDAAAEALLGSLLPAEVAKRMTRE